MRVIAIIVMLLIGMLIVLILPIKPEVKTLMNIIMFAIAMWRITIRIDYMMKKYPPNPIASIEE